MMPSAPGLFSTTKGCPICSPSFCATILATVSVGPPGAKGTMRCGGLAGYCAQAGRAAQASITSEFRSIMGISLRVGLLAVERERAHGRQVVEGEEHRVFRRG